MHYIKNKTYEEIGEYYGLSHARIKDIVERAKQKAIKLGKKLKINYYL